MKATKEELREMIISPAWLAVCEYLDTYRKDCLKRLAVAVTMDEVRELQAYIRVMEEVLRAPKKIIEREENSGKT